MALQAASIPEEFLADDRMDTPVAVGDLGDAEIDGDRH